MSLAKLNARDVAKDFGMQAKAITAILTEHTKENVSPTKILTDRELTIIFEHLTQNNQVESIESIFDDVYHEPEAPKAPAAEAPKAKEEAPAEEKPARADKKAPAAAEAQTDEADKSTVYYQLAAAYNAREMKPQAIAAFKQVTAGPAAQNAAAALAELSK